MAWRSGFAVRRKGCSLSCGDSHGGRDRLSQRLPVGRVADQFDQSGLVCAGKGEDMDGAMGAMGERAEGPGRQREGLSECRSPPPGLVAPLQRSLDLSIGPDWAFTGCGPLKFQRWWEKHSGLCVASGGQAQLCCPSPSFAPRRPVHGRTDRRMPEGWMELPLSPRPGDLCLLRESPFLILRWWKPLALGHTDGVGLGG